MAATAAAAAKLNNSPVLPPLPKTIRCFALGTRIITLIQSIGFVLIRSSYLCFGTTRNYIISLYQIYSFGFGVKDMGWYYCLLL